MQIHELQKSKWLKDKARRKGRGNATGTGNYSGKGLKGQKARSWHSMKPFFEGGQTSIVQRLPKARGFTRYYKLVKEVAIINIGSLDADERISDAMEISKQLLKDLWYIKSATVCVKILWQGDYTKHLTFLDIDTFSASAKAKMEKPGTVRSLAKKAPVKVVKDPKSKVGKLKIKTRLQKLAAQKTQKNVFSKEAASAKVVEKKIIEKKVVEKKVAAPKKATKVVAKATTPEKKTPVKAAVKKVAPAKKAK